MTPARHTQRHTELHASFDELLADYLAHHPKRHIETVNVLDLVQWSNEQRSQATLPGATTRVPIVQPTCATRESWLMIAEVLSDPQKWQRTIKPEPELVEKLLAAVALSIEEVGQGNGIHVHIPLTEQEEAACVYAANPTQLDALGQLLAGSDEPAS